ncbi:hypothetical protein Taro_026590, partial [Colocasia esculenta]|nr:hypothetical protein [Colocasia esculenta]
RWGLGLVPRGAHGTASASGHSVCTRSPPITRWPYICQCPPRGPRPSHPISVDSIAQEEPAIKKGPCDEVASSPCGGRAGRGEAAEEELGRAVQREEDRERFPASGALGKGCTCEMDRSMGNVTTYPTQNGTASAVCNGNRRINVYIWDMDETLILLKSLLDGTYGGSFRGSKDVQKGKEIGKLWETHILEVCDKYFFYQQIENYNEPFLAAVSDYDDGRDLSDYDFFNDGLCDPYDDANKRKLAYRHRIIGQKYAQGLRDVLDEGMIKLWNDLYNLTDSYTDGWLSSARTTLDQILHGRICIADQAGLDNATNFAVPKCENINFLVTSGSLIPSLVKCLLFRFDGLISHENVYSSWEVGKLQCFRWIKERFKGAKVQFCAIGDGIEECRAAEVMQWPFVKVDFCPSGTHRFPGLTKTMLQYYMEVIYGESNAEDGDDI